MGDVERWGTVDHCVSCLHLRYHLFLFEGSSPWHHVQHRVVGRRGAYLYGQESEQGHELLFSVNGCQTQNCSLFEADEREGEGSVVSGSSVFSKTRTLIIEGTDPVVPFTIADRRLAFLLFVGYNRFG